MFNCGKFEYALEIYQKGLRVSPNNFDVVIGTANVLREVMSQRIYKTKVLIVCTHI